MKQAKSTGLSHSRNDLPVIILARGEKIRYFVVRPWKTALACSLFALAFLYLSATAYLLWRDDLMSATDAERALLVQQYEDRIADLRSQLDRMTSKQVLDQQAVERQIAELIDRQERLKQRSNTLGAVLNRAGDLDLRGSEAPIPTPRPDDRADLEEKAGEPDRTIITGTAFAASAISQVPWPLRTGHRESEIRPIDNRFAAIARSLEELEASQHIRIARATEKIYQRAEAIADALSTAGIRVAEDYGERDIGGPFLAAGETGPFEERVRELDEALTRLEELRQTALSVPLSNPAPGATVTSGFGVRRDPFLRRPALHSGIDFRASPGTPVHVTAAGTVAKAGWNGGYGRMVEVDHGGGVTTRYAHLSKIAVRAGEQVGEGTIIGRVGSSGRSTGPHLHYEIRRNGEAVNPLKFISAGKRILALL